MTMWILVAAAIAAIWIAVAVPVALVVGRALDIADTRGTTDDAAAPRTDQFAIAAEGRHS